MGLVVLSVPGLEHRMAHDGPVAAGVLFRLSEALPGPFSLMGHHLFLTGEDTEALLLTAFAALKQAPLAAVVTKGPMWVAEHQVFGAPVMRASRLVDNIRVGELGLLDMETSCPDGVGEFAPPPALANLGCRALLKDYRS